MHHAWKDVVEDWIAAKGSIPDPFTIFPSGPYRVRLTSQGVEARASLKGTGNQAAKDHLLRFVFKDPGFIERFGDWLFPSPSVRPPVRGAGRFVRMEKIHLERPQTVVIHQPESVSIHDPQQKPVHVRPDGSVKKAAGRLSVSDPVVEFAVLLRAEGKTWKEIARHWSQQNPEIRERSTQSERH
jgi:hypothetical protein